MDRHTQDEDKLVRSRAFWGVTVRRSIELSIKYIAQGPLNKLFPCA